MTLEEALPAYFRGERALAFALVAYGLLALGAAFCVWRTQSGGFAAGLAVPLLLVGLGTIVGGTLFERKSSAQVDALVAQLESAPDVLVREETTRIAGVNANWPRLKMGWCGLAIVALALLQLVKRDWSQGLGLALLLLATTLFFVDVFAERRAIEYASALSRASGEGSGR